MKSFNEYTAADFLENESFIRYAKGQDPSARAFWEDWMAQKPANLEALLLAKALLEGLPVQQPEVNAFSKRLKDRLDATLQQATPVVSLNPGLPQKRDFPWMRVAAILIVLLGAGLLYYLLQPSPTRSQVFATKGGEIRSFILPDRSTITLSGNSQLVLAPNWRNSHRELWIRGEGFFEVQHIEADQQKAYPFTVHAGGMNVEVLGTTFNVKNRHAQTAVFLQSGKVRARAGGKELLLQPGHTVFNDSLAGSLVVQPAQDEPTAWLQHQVVFSETPLEKVCSRLQDFYNLPFLVRTEGLKAKTISGTISTESLPDLARTLARLLDATVQVEQDKVIITRK